MTCLRSLRIGFYGAVDISEPIPKNIRLQKELDLEEALSENEFLNHIEKLSKKNKNYKSFIGSGIPPVSNTISNKKKYSGEP